MFLSCFCCLIINEWHEGSTSASGLVVKSNVAIVGPRVRFSAGAVVLLLLSFGDIFSIFENHGSTNLVVSITQIFTLISFLISISSFYALFCFKMVENFVNQYVLIPPMIFFRIFIFAKKKICHFSKLCKRKQIRTVENEI